MDLLNRSLTTLGRERVWRDLLTPALLLLASHRPLAFVAGQMLYLLDPLAAVAGQPRLQRWADLLNDPERLVEFESSLARSAMSSTEQTQHDGQQ